MKTRAIRIEKFGGAEVMQFQEVDIPPPGTGEACIRHTAIGLNFIDVYHRNGLYPQELPAGLGLEAAGIIESTGAGVTSLAPGDHVVYTGSAGAYSERRVFDAERMVAIPPGVSDEEAAAALLKGMTAWFLLHKSYAVQAGDPILLHAAAGGVGSIVAQWAKHLGAMVIGVVSNDEKAAAAKASGCEHIIMADCPTIAQEVRRITGGDGVAAAYDSVGKATFYSSLDSLRPHGVLVTYGNASGPVDAFAPAELAKRHSLYVTRPVLFDFIDTRERLQEASAALFDLMANGVIRVCINQRYALKDAAEAHRDLESRKTSGSTILVPD